MTVPARGRRLPGVSTSRVLLVDERRLLAGGLAQLLREHPFVAEAQVLQDRTALASAMTGGWDVVLCSEPYAGPVLRLAGPQTRVLVLVQDPDVPRVAALLRRGAAGVCSPEDGLEDVAQAVAQAARWEMRLPTHLVAGVLEELQRLQVLADGAHEVLGRLTERERDVLLGLGQGNGRTEIGRELGLSTNTVRTHVQHVLRKLGLHSQLEASAYARDLMAALAEPSDVPGALVLDLDVPRPGRDPRSTVEGLMHLQ